MFTNLPIDHVNTSIAESSGRVNRKGSPTRVLKNRANQLPQFSAAELAIHSSPYFTLQAHAKPTIENRRLLPLPEDLMGHLNSSVGYRHGKISAGTYPGMQ
jgi:hypothetical protein